MKSRKILRGLFLTIGLLIVLYIIFNLIFNNVSYTIKPALLIISIMMYVTIIFILWKIYQKFLINKKHGSFILFSIFIIVQIIFACLFIVKPSWDFGTVYNIVLDDLLNRSSMFNSIYMNQVKINLGIALLLKIVFMPCVALGINHYVIVGILLNIIFINAGLFYLYKLITLVTDKKISSLCLLLTLTFTPFICYVPIFYTDTLSLPFSIIGIYYVYKYFYTKEKKAKSLVYSGLSIGLGTIIKPTVLIVYIAIIIWLIVREKSDSIRGTIKRIILLSIFLIIPVLLFNLYTSNSLDKEMLDQYQVPKTHWIMMGLKNYGGFNSEDPDFTVSFPNEAQKKKANIRVIKERLKNYIENKELLKFYTNKLTYTWGDGTFYAPVKLSREPKYNTAASEYIYGSQKDYFYSFAQAEWLIMLILITIGILVRPYLTYRQRDLQLLSLISTAGILLFLLIWETRSRYLVNLLPVILVSSYIGLIGLYNKYKLTKKRKVL